MKPAELNNLSSEDASIIRELEPLLSISFVKRLAKGQERKFYIETTEGEKRMLRITNMEYYEWTKSDVLMYQYVATAGINVMRLIDMGVFCNRTLCYQLFSWFDGEDLAEALQHMNYRNQYITGIKSGTLMRKLHTLPPINEIEPFGIRFRQKVQQVIDDCQKKADESDDVAVLVRYLQEHQNLLNNRPQTFTHGDWNAENLILCSDGQIGMIDLSGENDSGDPWWEFWLIPSHLDKSPYFYTGQINGYFDGNPPTDFFPLLAYYLTYATLKFLDEFSEEECKKNVECILNWFDHMQNPIPSWYCSDVY